MLSDLMEIVTIPNAADVPPEKREMWQKFDEHSQIVSQAANEILAGWESDGALPRPEEGRKAVYKEFGDALVANLVYQRLWTGWFKRVSDNDLRQLVSEAEELPPKESSRNN